MLKKYYEKDLPESMKTNLVQACSYTSNVESVSKCFQFKSYCESYVHDNIA